MVAFSKENGINLCVPGPDQQLVDGIEEVFRKGGRAYKCQLPTPGKGNAFTDWQFYRLRASVALLYLNRLYAAGIPCFGPTPEAARLEGSKAFSKDFMARHKIPTARYANFTSFSDAKSHIESVDYRVVLKADGLALGKGVLLPTTKEEAIAGLEEIMVTKAFGSAGDAVVIEEFLEGQELSVLAFSDGYTVLPFPAAQDHKRIGEGDTGLNTGGMGTYSPAPIATKDLEKRIVKEALQPTIDGMRKDGQSTRIIS